MAFGDRKDGKLIRNLDSLHFITGVLYPNRCDNEAFISETIDLTNLNKYLKKKNKNNDTDYKYNLFQSIVTAIAKTITTRQRMNRFIVNGNFYQRNEVSVSFVVKKILEEDAGEMLAFIHAKDDDNIDTIHNEIYKQVTSVRHKKNDQTTDSMDAFNKLPRFISKTAIHFIMWLDKHGWVPKSLIATDPYYSSCVVSNLGSIKMKAGYHHLTNWGTCSMIVLIGEIKDKPFYKKDGSVVMKQTVDLGITVDERIADGMYYSKTVKILKKILENPELLEEPLNKRVEI